MNVQTIIGQTSSIIRRYLSSDYKILLFGSQANGNAIQSSDIDIAVVGNERVPSVLMAKIRNEVDEIRTLREIDVIDLLTVDEQYRNNVLSYAKEITT